MIKIHDTIAVLYTTVENNVNAFHIVNSLLKKKLIACANIISNVQSSYIWNDEICTESEVIIIFKTKKSLVKKTVKELKKIHSYEIPCILEIFEAKVHDQSYLDWITKVTI